MQPRYGWSAASTTHGNPYVSESHPSWPGNGVPAPHPPVHETKVKVYALKAMEPTSVGPRSVTQVTMQAFPSQSQGMPLLQCLQFPPVPDKEDHTWE